MAQQSDRLIIPQVLVEAYNRAKRYYIDNEDTQSAWSRGTLEDFKDALQNLVEASTASGAAVRDSKKLRALEYLQAVVNPEITPGRSKTPIPAGAVSFPQPVVELYDAAATAYLEYTAVVPKPRGSLISLFRDALDHLCDGADSSTPAPERPLLIALSMEHLLLVAAESYQWAALKLRRRAMRFLFLRRLIQSRLPSKATTEQMLNLIGGSISDGRSTKGQIRNWRGCVANFKKAYDTAFLLEAEMAGGKLNVFGYIMVAVLLSAVGSLVAAVILLIVNGL